MCIIFLNYSYLARIRLWPKWWHKSRVICYWRQRWDHHCPRVIIIVVPLKGSTGPQSTQGPHGPHAYHNNSSTNFTSVCQIYMSMSCIGTWKNRTEPNQTKEKMSKERREPSQRGICSVWISPTWHWPNTLPHALLSSTDFVCCVCFIFLRKIKKCKS